MESPEVSPRHAWLQRFSTAELAVVVFIFSALSALVWYKTIYQPHIAVIPSKSSASQESPTPIPTSPATPTPIESSVETSATNPLSNAYTNPFAQ